MVIQLPRDIEERLNALAEREGKPAAQLAVDAINTVYPAPSPSRPTSTSVEASSNPSGGDVWGDEDPPWAGLIGMFPDGGVDSGKFEDWLEAERASDERLARKSSPSG